MPDRLLSVKASRSTLKDVLSRRARRVALATGNIATPDARFGGGGGSLSVNNSRHVIGTSAVEEALAIASQQTYDDKKYRLVLGSHRLDVPKRPPIPVQPQRKKRWQRGPQDHGDPAGSSSSPSQRVPAVWKSSTLPAVRYVPGNLSAVAVKQHRWNSPWNGYLAAAHQAHVPASRQEDFHRRGGNGFGSPDSGGAGWGRQVDLARVSRRLTIRRFDNKRRPSTSPTGGAGAHSPGGGFRRIAVGGGRRGGGGTAPAQPGGEGAGGGGGGRQGLGSRQLDSRPSTGSRARSVLHDNDSAVGDGGQHSRTVEPPREGEYRDGGVKMWGTRDAVGPNQTADQ